MYRQPIENKMNREIKFRGKRKLNGDWVFGSYLPSLIEDSCEIVRGNHYHDDDSECDFIRVITKTVGQFTGFIVKESKKNVEFEIYEDDIFRHTKETDKGDITTYSVVMWIKQRGAFYFVPVEHYEVVKNNDVSKEKQFEWLFQDACLYDFSIDVRLMKVGNIHDNPELLTN